MRVEDYHFNYLGEDQSGQTIELWGCDAVTRSRVPWGSMCGRVIIENRQQRRALKRNQDREAYYAHRDLYELETIRPLQEAGA